MVLLVRRLVVAIVSSVVFRPLPVPAVDSLAARVAASAALLDKMSNNWSELTISCNYAEADRVMMQNKTLLMEKASVKGAYQVNSSVVVNVCKVATGRGQNSLALVPSQPRFPIPCKVDTDAVRPLLAKDSALRRLSPQLTMPGTLSLVDPDDA
jgi:hypothetical protein